MTPPDLTQPQRLDLAEGKRLLSEDEAMRAEIRALPPDTPVVRFHGPDGVTTLHKWLYDNADALLSAAEEAEKLRPLVDTAETMVREYDEEIAAHVAQHGNVAGTKYGATRRIEPLRKALAALTQPEPTPGASSSS